MDTSFWTALNPNIQVLDTKKLLHGQYMHRLSMLSFGSRLLRDPSRLDNEITHYNQRAYSYGGSWRQTRQLTDEDVQLLKLIKNIVYADDLSHLGNLKVRIEDPHIQFYSTDAAVLKDLALKLRHTDNSHFVSFMCPESEQSADLLKQGFVLKKKKIDWPYRIIIRDGRYNTESKTNLKNYLLQLGDEVKAPRNLWEQLEKGGWIWGGYIYVKDKQMATMFSMIDANMIGRLEEFRISSNTK